MASSVHLAIDIGAESGRVIAGVFDGASLSMEEIHRFPNKPLEGMRWNFDAELGSIWEEVQLGLSKANARYGEAVQSVGVDTWGVDYGLLGESGALLGQPHQYRAPRNVSAMEATISRVGRERLYAATGIQFMPFNTIFQLVANQDELPAAKSLLFMPDLLNARLCGSRVAEETISSTSQLYDCPGRRWLTGLLDELGVPSGYLPEVTPPGTVLGTLLTELNLPPWKVVAVASHDTASAVVGVPATTGNWAFISSGTWSIVGVELDHSVRTPAALAAGISNEGGFAGTTRFCKNVTGLWIAQGLLRESDVASYAELAEMAAAAQPFAHLFDPDHPSLLAPASMTAAVGALIGRQAPIGVLARATFESLALKYAWVLERVQEASATKIERVHIVGGGSNNALLNQLAANATGLPVLAGPTEATALGNLLVQLHALGYVDGLSEMRRLGAAVTQPKRFEPTDKDAWLQARDRYWRLLS